MCSADYAEFWEDFFTERLPYELFSLCNCPTTGAVQHMVTLPYVIAFWKLDVTSSDHNRLIAVALLGRAEASPTLVMQIEIFSMYICPAASYVFPYIFLF